ncbi:MAG: hypothetical protein E7406_08300 [Ruminococcaceae bacterium]|nr:hypothetical protein [Oscillospiraceae bacterium]
MKKFLSLLLSLLMCTTLISGCNKPASSGSGVSDDTLFSEEEISYVMIYNPEIYDENIMVNARLNTGDFAESVEAMISRADGAKEIPEFIPMSISDISEGLELDKFDLGGSRGGAFITPYSVGDTHDFYCGADSRVLKTFVCRYAGEDCNIWTCDNSVSDSDIISFGNEFDNKIYDSVTEEFGESRFYANGGKVNILLYPMSGSLGGFFHPYDLYASDEVSEAEKTTYALHTDHDVININSVNLVLPEYVYGTAAHEFQHLICFTAFFDTVNYTDMRTWLNEAMSGYIEEKLYPGTKKLAGHYEEFNASNRIRHGQSLYNFDNETTRSNFDIGVYGSVYLFSEYLSSIGGEKVFSNIHSYWRNSYSTTLDEAEAIINSIPESAYNKINNQFDFSEISFEDSDYEFMSKLTLSFYLSLLDVDSSDPDAYKNVKSQTLLYDEINPADIEGGGRVIVALKDGEFKFPEDADEGLIYIGLNKDFEVVTDIVIH